MPDLSVFAKKTYQLRVWYLDSGAGYFHQGLIHSVGITLIPDKEALFSFELVWLRSNHGNTGWSDLAERELSFSSKSIANFEALIRLQTCDITSPCIGWIQFIHEGDGLGRYLTK